MPIILPDYLKVNNPNEPVVRLEDKQIKGVAIIDTLSNKNGINASLRVEGYQAYVQETDKTYAYISDDLGDAAWVLDSNWKVITGDSFVFDQSSSTSDTWVITHNLNKYPSILIIDSDGDNVEGYTVVYNTTLKLTITFKSNGSLVAISGYAYLN